MAGETTKTTLRTNADSGLKSDARLGEGRLRVGRDYHAYGTGELEATDKLLTNIYMPSNAILSEVLVGNDDLGTTLTIDIGLYAKEKFISTTSGSETIHAVDSILDADLLVDGASLADASLKLTSLNLDAGTAGMDDLHKPLWELLGYDFDPRTYFGIAVTVASSGTPAAGDVQFEARYLID